MIAFHRIIIADCHNCGHPYEGRGVCPRCGHIPKSAADQD